MYLSISDITLAEFGVKLGQKLCGPLDVLGNQLQAQKENVGKSRDQLLDRKYLGGYLDGSGRGRELVLQEARRLDPSL